MLKNQFWVRDSGTLSGLTVSKGNHNYTEFFVRELLFMSSPRFIQHTFADARSISEDPGCVLGEPKILNGDGAQLSLNQAETKYRKHFCECNERGEIRLNV